MDYLNKLRRLAISENEDNQNEIPDESESKPKRKPKPKEQVIRRKKPKKGPGRVVNQYYQTRQHKPDPNIVWGDTDDPYDNESMKAPEFYGDYHPKDYGLSSLWSPEDEWNPDDLVEDYDDEVNPGIRRFWSGVRTSQHDWSKHPIFAMYGDELARKGFGKYSDDLLRLFPEVADKPPQQRLPYILNKAFSLFSRLGAMEAPFKSQLERIAVEAVSEVYGVPKGLLKARLTRGTVRPTRGGIGDPEDLTPGGPPRRNQGRRDEEQLTPKMREAINKRTTLLLLTQGAAIDNMNNLHHVVQDKIRELNGGEELLRVYNSIGPGMLSLYWTTDWSAMSQDYRNMATGVTELVNLEPDEEQGKKPGSKGYTKGVYAQANNFPILIQELVKGVFQLLMTHGVTDLSKEEQKEVVKRSDLWYHEPWMIQIGPHVWKSFLKIVPRGSNLPVVIARLASQDAKFIHDILSQTIESIHADLDPEEQRQAISDMLDRVEKRADQSGDSKLRNTDFNKLRDDFGIDYGDGDYDDDDDDDDDYGDGDYGDGDYDDDDDDYDYS